MGSRALPPRTRAPRVGKYDQIVVLRNIPWQQYDDLCEARKDSAGPRMAYLDGTLEIMSPARKHEYEKKLLARLIETYGEEAGLSLNGFGSETFREKAEEAGVEPDECYCMGPAQKHPELRDRSDPQARRHRQAGDLPPFEGHRGIGSGRRGASRSTA